MRGRPLIFPAFVTSVVVLVCCFVAWAESPHPDIRVPVLVYHRFGPVVADSMTVTTKVFESHLRYLHDNDYTVIPVRQLVDYRLGRMLSLPARSVAITADDGHRSVYTEMLPLVRRYHLPVTLFIYPSAISNADYAMTWNQLGELVQTGLFDIQSHTYWHPNFKVEKRRLAPAAYERFVAMQLTRSREILERNLHASIDMLAWPFGIYDEDLIRQATQAAYIAGFTIERRHISMQDNVMTLPRYLMTNADRGSAFEQLLAGRRQDPQQLKAIPSPRAER